jgi:hypothetical protein
MTQIPGFRPFLVTATRKGEAAPNPALTASFDLEVHAREYAESNIPDHYVTQVYELTAKALPPDHHSRAELIARNGRWGTCSGCPRDAKGTVFPERCGFTDRYDHNLSPNAH